MPPPDAFSTILTSEGIVSAEQLAEVVRINSTTGKKVHDELIRLGYAPAERVMTALAKAHRLKFVDLTGVAVPQEVVDLLPESVARENTIFPVSVDGGSLHVVGCDPTDI